MATEMKTEPLEETRAKIEELRDKEWQWNDRYEAAVRAEAEAQRTSGAAVLANPDEASRYAAIMAHARDEAAIAREAIDEARRQRAAMRREYFRLEAEQQQAEAAKLTAEADQHQERTTELLNALKEHEGIPYEGAVSGISHAANGHLVINHHESRTNTLRRQAADLRKQAQDWERHADGFDRGGEVTASSRDELKADLRARDAMRIAPSWPVIDAWLLEREARLADYLERAWNMRDRDIAIYLHWTEGKIDRQSRLSLSNRHGVQDMAW